MNELKMRLGRYYTPKHLVDIAYEKMDEYLGNGWRERYVVWDNSCGEKALTKDYTFKELYSSTIDKAELEASSGYNADSTSFVFDFLNDDDDALPDGLKTALRENKPLLFLINPPYGTAASGSQRKTKAGIAKNTKVYDLMKRDKIGRSSLNLYAQFIYRILLIKRKYALNNVKICMFSLVNHFSLPNFKGLRKEFFNDFKLDYGFIFPAKEFDDIIGDFPLIFGIYSIGKQEDTENFLVDMLEKGVKIGEKLLYNTDSEKITLKEWVNEPVKHLKKKEVPLFTSGLKLKYVYTTHNGYNFDGSIGDFCTIGFDTSHNSQGVALSNGAYSIGHDVGISENNFDRVSSAFTARASIKPTWYNGKDCYSVPEENTLYDEYLSDAYVFTVFHPKNNITSLRDIWWNGKTYNFDNAFFFLPVNFIKDLAVVNNNEKCLKDIEGRTDSFWLRKTSGRTLSEEAMAVLDKAKDIVIKTFKYREEFNDKHQEYQINNWDCSWYQLKALAKEYAKDDLEEFNVLFKKLNERIIPMVYKLGFLKR